MKTNKLRKLLYAFGVGLSTAAVVSSCSLDEYNPVVIAEDDVLYNFDGWKAYQANCYTNLWGPLIGMPYGIVSEGGTDLWTFPYGNHNQYKDLLAYEEFTFNSNIVRNTWDYAWGSINHCNHAIALADQLNDGNAEDIAVLVAETKLLRGYYYSVLVTQFGELPLVVTNDPVKNLSPQRNTVPEIYKQIISDLRAAFNALPVEPYEGNLARATKKSALGLLARVYAQGAGEDLREGDKTYWVRAKEVADSLINNKGAYGAALYDDFAEVFAADNNRNNRESLFTAYGLNPHDESFDYYTGGSQPNLYLHYYPKLDDAFGTTDIFKRGVNANTSNAYYGRLNQQFIAPTKYLIDCFDAQYDKRWENTFVTAFTNYSGVQALNSLGTGAPNPAKVPYEDAVVTLTEAMCTKYGLDLSHVGKKIYPYVDVNAKMGDNNKNATWQYIPKIWEKDAHSGSVADLQTLPNANVHPYPLAADEDRFFAYLSKENLSASEKKERAYVTVNINELFDLASDATGSTYKSVSANNNLKPANLASLFPSMMKFNHNFDGGWLGGNFQRKMGNIMIMRMAEVYLIAAEAVFHTTNDGAAAAGYLNELRKRACRDAADFNTATGMQLTTATMNDVFDEYARELCGEFNRWALLKRNKAFETRLPVYNKTAAANFIPSRHYKRPIPFSFLNQINNADEFGNNGY